MQTNPPASMRKPYRAMLVLGGVLALGAPLAHATTITVTNASDSGEGTLRQAILDANADASPDPITIGFNIPGAGVRTISPLTALPTITRPMTIDGYTQPGASPNTLANADNAVLQIELSGASLGAPAYGLWITGNGCSVRGLVINRFTPGTAGLLFQNSEGHVVEGCFIGTDVTGTNVLGNDTGILVLSSGLRVGGTTPAARNLIGGNNVGINVGTSVGDLVQGNFIGVGADGITALPQGHGLFLQTCSQMQIGGMGGARNVISGNNNGCWISAGASNVIQGNFIGTDASGTLPRGNINGIVLIESACNVIGGTGAGAGNLCSGNTSVGFHIAGLGASNNLVVGNLVGTDVTGTNGLANETGVYLGGGTGNRIGGLTAASRNIVSGNLHGILVQGMFGTNEVFGNYVGLGSDGMTLVTNVNGIYLHNAAYVQIGGALPGARNVISGNATGCVVYNGGSNVVQGNFIGTDFSGALPRGNGSGITMSDSAGNLIGGPSFGEGNLISDNSSQGLYVSGLDGTNNVISGNLIGTDVTGTNSLGNGYYGLFVGSSGNVIGGLIPGAGNVISGNGVHGLALYYSGNTGNVVQGNFIGTDRTGTLNISNKHSGVVIVSASGNLIGGTIPGAANVIGFNRYSGVAITGDTATNNAVLGNSIFAHSWAGIDLALDDTTPNDPGDADGSPNHYQNFPELFSVKLAGGDLTVRYQVDSATVRSAYPLLIEFFRGDAGGDGRTILHRHTYDTPQSFTNVTFTSPVGVTEGDPIVATATDANGNTSEFAAPALVTVNRRPLVANPILDQNALYGSVFSYQLPVGVFADPDAGDSLSYSAAGLPPGLTFNPSTRTFSGTPTNAGTFSVTVTATDDGLPPLSTNDVFDITVAKASLVVTANNKSKLQGQPNPPLDGTLVGVANSDNITVLFETTATLASSPGNYPITPVFSDPNSRLAHYTVVTNLGALTVVDCSALAIKNASLPSATRGSAYAVTFTATNGSAPYAFAVTGGALPGNLSLASGGLLSGTATNAGNFSFTITATDALGCTVSSNYNLTVVCPAVTVNPFSLPGATRGIAYNQTVSASGGTGPYSFAVTSGALPDGISLSITGVLTGTPTTVGGSLFVVTATEAGGCTGNRTYSINVSCPTLTVLPFNQPDGYKGIPYSTTFTTTNGIAPYSYARSGGALPGGLILDPTGALSGTPTNTGFFSFTVLSTDAGGCTGSRTFNMIIELPPPNRWVGDGAANEWSFTDNNWSRGTFVNNDEVLFDDTGSNNVPINLTTLVSPATIYVNATQPYVFAGSGGIIGTGILTKANSGELVLTGSNSYSGPTRILGGTVTVQHNNALGTTAGGTVIEGVNAGVRLDGNRLSIAEPLTIDVPSVFDHFLTNGALINIAHTNTWSGPITIARANFDGPIAIRPLAGKLILNSTNPIAGPGHLNVRGDGDLVVESGIASNVGSLYAVGAGTYTLTGTNASSGTLSIAAGGRLILAPWSLGLGSLQCQSGTTIEVNAYGGNAVVNNWLRPIGGKLRASSGTVSCNGSIEVDLLRGCTFETASASDRLAFNSAVRHSGAGAGFPGTIYISGPGTVTFNAGVSIFQNGWLGDWTILGSTVILNHTNALSQRAIGLVSANLQTTADGGTHYSFQLSSSGNSTFQPGRSSMGVGVSNFFDTLWVGQLTVSPGSNLIAGSTADVGFGETGLSGDAVLSIENQGGVNARVTVMGGVLDDNRAYALTKAGAGTLVLAGHSFYSGGTVISNGTLRVSNASGSATGPGAVVAHGGATLAGVGRIAGTVTVRSGGTLAPGDSIGTLTISNHLMLEAGATNAMEVNLATLTTDKVVGLSNMTYGGTLVLTRLGATPYANGNAIKLFDADSYSGSFATIEPSSPGDGLQWNTSTLTTDGTLRVSAVAVPVPFALTNLLVLPSGPFQFSFTNTPGRGFTALSATNVSLPLSNWTLLGPVTEVSPGQFRFVDPQFTNHSYRFYRVSSP